MDYESALAFDELRNAYQPNQIIRSNETRRPTSSSVVLWHWAIRTTTFQTTTFQHSIPYISCIISPTHKCCWIIKSIINSTDLHSVSLPSFCHFSPKSNQFIIFDIILFILCLKLFEWWSHVVPNTIHCLWLEFMNINAVYSSDY